MATVRELRAVFTGHAQGIKSALQGVKTEIKDVQKTSKTTSERIAGNFKKAGDRMKGIGSTLTKTVTTSIAGIGTAAFAAANDMDAAYKDIRVGTGATGEDLEGLKEDFKEVFSDIPTDSATASSAIAGLNTMTGATGETLQGMTKSVLEASRMLGEDGVQNAESFGSALQQWGIPAEEGEEKMDALFKATQDYGVGLGTLTGNLNKFGPVLQNAGFSMEESADLMGRMEKGGIQVTRVMPGLNKAFRDWADEGKNGQEELQKTITKMKEAETETEALSIATETFGAEGAQRLTTAVRQGIFPALDDLGGPLEDTKGLVSETGEETRTFGDRMVELKNQAQLALEPLGEVLLDLFEQAMPYLEKGAEYVRNLAERFSNLSGPTKVFIVAIGAVLGALGPLLMALGTLVGSLTPLINVFVRLMPYFKYVRIAIGALTGPIGLLIAAVTLLGVIIYKNWDSIWKWTKEFFGKIADWLSTTWENIKTWVGDAVTKIVDGIKRDFGIIRDFVVNVFTTVRDFITNTWNGIKNTFNTVITWIVNLAKRLFNQFVENVKRDFNKVKNFFSTIWNAIKFVFSTVITAIVNFVRNRFNNLRDNTIRIFNAVRNFLSNVWDRIRTTVSEKVTAVWNKVKETWDRLKSRTAEIFQAIKDNVTQKFNDIVDMARKLPGRIGDGIKKMAKKAINAGIDLVNDIGTNLASGINKVIGALNGLLGKIGIGDGDLISKVTFSKIPKYAQGTDGHPGGPAIVGDGGKRELVQLPDGRFFLSPDKDTMLNLPKGTEVLSGSDTSHLLEDIPFYKDGIGSRIKGALNWAGDKVRGGASWVKDQGDKVFEWIGEGGKAIVNKVIEGLGINMPSMADFYGKFIRGSFGEVKDGLISYVDEKVSSIGDFFLGGDYTGPARFGAPGFGPPFRLTSRFGPRWGRLHAGVDYGAPMGTPIPAMAGGRVSYSGWGGGYGNMVDVALGGGRLHRYAHNMRNLVRAGQTVARGQILGLVGSTGNSTGPHVHFETRLNGRPLNPFSAGFADGGIVDTKQLAWIAEGGWAETIISHDPAKKARSKMLWDKTGDALGFKEENKLEEVIQVLRSIDDGIGEIPKERVIEMNGREVARETYKDVLEFQDLEERRKDRAWGR